MRGVDTDFMDNAYAGIGILELVIYIYYEIAILKNVKLISLIHLLFDLE